MCVRECLRLICERGVNEGFVTTYKISRAKFQKMQRRTVTARPGQRLHSQTSLIDVSNFAGLSRHEEHQALRSNDLQRPVLMERKADKASIRLPPVAN